MRNRGWFLAALLSLSLLAACTKGALWNPPAMTVPVSNESKVEEAIRFALTKRGWIAKQEAPGSILGTLNIRDHQAVIRITYGPSSYQIAYVSSSNLDYEQTSSGAKIHRNYNGWVENLVHDIDAYLGAPHRKVEHD